MDDTFDAFVKDVQERIIRDAKSYYSKKVVDLWLNPQNMGSLEQPDGYAKIKGPCGDTMEIFLRITGNRITRATFTTDGCGPSMAAGSMSTQLVSGKTLSDAAKLSPDDILNALGGLPEESQHCALLAANTLTEAIRGYLSTRAANGRDIADDERGGLNRADSAEASSGR
jgi:nitrogen fixation protein NifU and related proteins